MNETASDAPPDVLAALGRRSRRATWVRRFIHAGAILCAIAAITWGLQKHLANQAEANRLRFITEPVARRDLSMTVGATGTLEGLQTVEVGSEISGKIIEVKVDFNDSVEKGDVLAILDPEQARAAVDEAEANVTSADATVLEEQATNEESQLNLERADKQLEEGLISRQEYETFRAKEKRSQATLTRARASARLARASLKSAQSYLAKSVIVAPISGIVQSRLVEKGQTLTAGMETPVLFKLTENLREMRLAISIDEADIGRVREGQRATFTVDAYPDRAFESRVLSIHNEPDTQQNVVTYEGILSVDNGDLILRPGMTATATIVTEQKQGVLSVPSAAFRFTMPEIRRPGLGPPGQASARTTAPGLWILDGNMPVHRAARAGATDGRYAEFVSNDPIAAGTLVIVDTENAP